MKGEERTAQKYSRLGLLSITINIMVRIGKGTVRRVHNLCLGNGWWGYSRCKLVGKYNQRRVTCLEVGSVSSVFEDSHD